MAIRLATYFKRREDWDFRDDGNSFRCYEYKGMRISIHKSSYGYFICARLDSAFDYDLVSMDLEYLKVYDEAHAIFDRYNDGSDESQIDLKTWVKDLDYILDLIAKTPKPKPTIYFNELDEKYYGFKWERQYSKGDYSRKLSQIYINNNNINKFNVKRLVIQEK